MIRYDTLSEKEAGQWAADGESQPTTQLCSGQLHSAALLESGTHRQSNSNTTQTSLVRTCRTEQNRKITFQGPLYAVSNLEVYAGGRIKGPDLRGALWQNKWKGRYGRGHRRRKPLISDVIKVTSASFSFLWRWGRREKQASNDGSGTVEAQLPKRDQESLSVSSFVLLAAGFDLVCGLCRMFNVHSVFPETHVIV